LIEQRFKVCAVTLEANRVYVGEVVRDHAHALLLGIEAGFCDVKGVRHRFTPVLG
jgi:hypothetical protein